MYKEYFEKIFTIISKINPSNEDEKKFSSILKKIYPRFFDFISISNPYLNKRNLLALKIKALSETHHISMSFFNGNIFNKLDTSKKNILIKLLTDQEVFSENELISLAEIFNTHSNAIQSSPDSFLVNKFLKPKNHQYLSKIYDEIDKLILGGRNDLIDLIPNSLIESNLLNSRQKKSLIEWKIFYSKRYEDTFEIFSKIHQTNGNLKKESKLNKNKIIVGVFGRKLSPAYISSATSYISWLIALQKMDVDLIIFSDTPSTFVNSEFKSNFHLWFDIQNMSDVDVLNLFKKNNIDICLRMDSPRAIISDSQLRVPVIDILNIVDFYGGATYTIVNKHHITNWLLKNNRAKLLIFEKFWNYTLPTLPDIPTEKIDNLIFGVFNRATKISNECYSDWIQLLHKNPKYRLAFKFIQSGENTHISTHVKNIFAYNGIDPDRILFLPKTDQINHLKAYNFASHMLEPYPGCGGISTIESLWMNKPSLLCPKDDRNSSYGSVAMYNYFGIEPIIADSKSDLASQLDSWINLIDKSNFDYRSQIIASNLFNHEGFAEKIYLFLREINRSNTIQSNTESNL